MQASGKKVRLAAAVVAATVFFGCGDDDKNGNGNPSLNVRQGTWNVTSTTSYAGTGCQKQPETETTQEIICDLEEELNNPEIDCEITADGNSVDIDCTATASLPPCLLTVSASGGGTFSETSYDVTFTILTTVTGPPECGGFADPCTTMVHIVGTWASGEGDCSAAAPGTRVESFISRAVSKAGIPGQMGK